MGLAYNGIGALEYVASMRPDIVLLDLGLPDIDGYEVARRIRAGDAGQALALFAVSGYGQPEDIRRVVSAERFAAEYERLYGLAPREEAP